MLLINIIFYGNAKKKIIIQIAKIIKIFIFFFLISVHINLSYINLYVIDRKYYIKKKIKNK